MARLLFVFIASVAALSGACGKKQAGRAPVHVDGTPHTDAVLDAWKSAGLAPQGFAALEPAPYVASYCERGSVGGVDTLVCEYADEDALTKGQQQVRDEWARASVQTGVAVRTKRTLLTAVDRERHDPNGKTINQLVQTFRKL